MIKKISAVDQKKKKRKKNKKWLVGSIVEEFIENF